MFKVALWQIQQHTEFICFFNGLLQTNKSFQKFESHIYLFIHFCLSCTFQCNTNVPICCSLKHPCLHAILQEAFKIWLLHGSLWDSRHGNEENVTLISSFVFIDSEIQTPPTSKHSL